MAIEGPLRELGVHDVFQLLDLTRKTGVLHIRSELRDNDGAVRFVNGRVVGATMRDETHRLGRMLVQAGRVTEEELLGALAIQIQEGETRRLGEILVAVGAISRRELERQVRRQVEAVVFDLLSWSEGYFTFEEGEPGEASDNAGAGLTAEALLMEAARRIDEWARMADRVPDANVIPALCESPDGHASLLDLRPHEWQVLAAVDGVSSVRAIAASVGLSDFDAARIVYGLLATGVVAIVAPDEPVAVDALMHLSDAREAFGDGRLADALAAAQRTIRMEPATAEAHALAGLAMSEMGKLEEAIRALAQAVELEPRTDWMMAAARLAIGRGDLSTATRYWKQVVASDPHSPVAAHAREALDQATRLHAMAGAPNGR